MKKISSPRITQRNKVIKDIAKVIRSLENRRILLLKGTTGKTISQEGALLSFLDPLMSYH